MAVDKLRVLIVEDSEMAARIMWNMIEAQADMAVVGVATTGQEAVRRTAELHPDVVLMDVHLPDIDGIHATWLIASKNPDSSVIMVTSEERSEFMQRAMVAGAQGYLLKPVRDGAQLAHTMRTVRQRALERQASLVRTAGATPDLLTPAPPPPAWLPGGGLQRQRRPGQDGAGRESGRDLAPADQTASRAARR